MQSSPGPDGVQPSSRSGSRTKSRSWSRGWGTSRPGSRHGRRRKAGGRGRACGGRQPGRPAFVRTRPRSEAAAPGARAESGRLERRRPVRNLRLVGHGPDRVGLAQRRDGDDLDARVAARRSTAARRVSSRSPRLEPSPTYARKTYLVSVTTGALAKRSRGPVRPRDPGLRTRTVTDSTGKAATIASADAPASDSSNR